MSEKNESGEKTEEPSLKKLQDARKKGEVPRSHDLTSAFALAGMIAALFTFFKNDALYTIHVLSELLADPEGKIDTHKTSKSPTYTFWPLVGFLYPVFVIPAMAAITAMFVQNSVVISGSKITPRLTKISLLSGFKNKFGISGLFEFSKSSVKLILFSILSGAFLFSRSDEIIATAQMPFQVVIATLGGHAFDFMVYVCIVVTIIGTVDFLWQYKDHYRKNMMSKKEVQDEHKESEGDPHTKGRRRQKGYEIAMNQMISNVPDATVVIVNPTHYAVALQWSLTSGHPPVCIAKGTDELASRIRFAAESAHVPIYRSPMTARSIFTSVEIGEVIFQKDFRAVAAAIRFSENMRKP